MSVPKPFANPVRNIVVISILSSPHQEFHVEAWLPAFQMTPDNDFVFRDVGIEAAVHEVIVAAVSHDAPFLGIGDKNLLRMIVIISDVYRLFFCLSETFISIVRYFFISPI